MSTEAKSDDYFIVHELYLGEAILPSNSIVRLGKYYSYGSSLQVCLLPGDTASMEHWFGLTQIMMAQDKYILLLSYPPSYSDSNDRMPILIVELGVDKTVRTLEIHEANLLSKQALALLNRQSPLDLLQLKAILGSVPDWAEIKHLM